MNDCEYLVGYGLVGDFGRFRSPRPVDCRRSDRVVVRTPRGLELGTVLRSAVSGHAAFLPNTTVGQFVRVATAEDERKAIELARRGDDILVRATELVGEQSLPLDLLDVEMLLDGEHVVFHILRRAECDVRPLVSTLSRESGLHVLLADLTRAGMAPLEENEETEAASCGSCDSGGCGDCGSGGGCGSCGSSKHEVAAHTDQARFVALREQMEQQRTPLI